MPLYDPGGIVPGKPGPAVCVLPDEHFQRQIDSDRLFVLHEWRATLGVSEDHKVGGTQGHSGLCSTGRMVDPREDRQAFRFYCREKTLHRLAGAVAAFQRNQSCDAHAQTPACRFQTFSL